jgi:hypothetical protein
VTPVLNQACAFVRDIGLPVLGPLPPPVDLSGPPDRPPPGRLAGWRPACAHLVLAWQPNRPLLTVPLLVRGSLGRLRGSRHLHPRDDPWLRDRRPGRRGPPHRQFRDDPVVGLHRTVGRPARRRSLGPPPRPDQYQRRRPAAADCPPGPSSSASTTGTTGPCGSERRPVGAFALAAAVLAVDGWDTPPSPGCPGLSPSSATSPPRLFPGAPVSPRDVTIHPVEPAGPALPPRGPVSGLGGGSRCPGR